MVKAVFSDGSGWKQAARRLRGDMLRAGAKTRAVAEKFSRAEVTIRSVAKTAGVKLAPRCYTPVPKRYRDEVVRLSEPVAKLLEQAAKRRGKTYALLASEILTGVVTRGSVDRLPDSFDHPVELAEDYEEKREAENVRETAEV